MPEAGAPITRPNSWTTRRRPPAELDIFLTLPIAVTKKSVEYIYVIFHVTANQTEATHRKKKDSPRQSKIVTVAGAHLTLTAKVAKPLVAAVAKFGAEIDAGVLDNLISDALLDAVVKPLDAVALPGEAGRSGRTWEDFFEMVGQQFGDQLSYVPGADADFDVEEFGNAMMAVGAVYEGAALVMLITPAAPLAPAVVAAGVVCQGIGGVAYLAAKIGDRKEYPPDPIVTPDQAAKTYALIASLMGDRVVASMLRRSLVIHTGGGVDAPEPQRNELQLLGWPRFDALIIASIREMLRLESGAGVTTPTGDDTTVRPVIDPHGIFVRDPLWDPWYLQAALASANNRAAMINSLSSRMVAVDPNVIGLKP